MIGPKVKFEGNTTYKDVFKEFKVMPEDHSSGKGCPVEGNYVPPFNYLNSSPHMYYDEKNKKLV